jgi:FAD/FMN-containing dehydrogenase
VSIGRFAGLDLLPVEDYARDHSPFAVTPSIAVAARDAGDVEGVLRLAADRGVPVTARAGGSSVAGQCLGEGVVLDVGGLGGVELEGDDVWCGVGESLDDVNRVLASARRTIGPDVTSSDLARVGGLVATNACGSRSLRYGRIGEAVRAAEGALAGGEPMALAGGEMPERLRPGLSLARAGLEDELRGAWPRQPRSFGGYRLDAFASRGDALSLVPGSEGTLCVLTRVRLATVPAPRRRALLELRCDSLRGALDRAPACAQTGASAVEVLDRWLLDAAGLSYGSDGALLLVEYLDDEDGPDRLRAALPGDDVIALSEPHAGRTWTLRREALSLLAARGAAPVALFEDPAVAPERAGVFAEDLLALLRRRGFERVVVYGHAGAGCLHVRPLCDPGDPSTGPRLLDAASEVAELVSAHGGALTGEHGWGLARSHLAPAALGRALYRRCEQVKRAWDPDGLLNPGRIVGGTEPRDAFALA